MIDYFNVILIDVDPKRLIVFNIVWRSVSPVYACKYLDKEYDLLIDWDADLEIFDGVRFDIERILIELSAGSTS